MLDNKDARKGGFVLGQAYDVEVNQSICLLSSLAKLMLYGFRIWKNLLMLVGGYEELLVVRPRRVGCWAL